MPVYADHLRKIIKQGVSRKDNPEKPLEGFKIAVDPGNGGGGFFATDVLAPLGADVSGGCCVTAEAVACMHSHAGGLPLEDIKADILSGVTFIV